jgi:hypothetical protein
MVTCNDIRLFGSSEALYPGIKIICTNGGLLNDLHLIRFGSIFGAFCSADPDNVANPIYQWQS